MLRALKNSPEKKELIELAIKYLRGVKGTLVQQKKRDREKAQGLNQNIGATNNAVAMATDARQLQVGAGPLPSPHGADGQRMPHSTQYTNIQGQHRPFVPQQQQNGVAQRTYPQQPQGARPAQTGHNKGQFDERDVENALRGFLGQ